MKRAFALVASRLSRDNLLAIPIAAGLAFALLWLAPAEWFLRVHSIQIVQTSTGRAMVIQARTTWPRKALTVQWVAQVDKIVVDSGGQVTGSTVCSGHGHATIRDDAFEVVRMPLADWVGDPTCAPELAEVHIAHASWTFDVLGFPKTATARSAAFTLGDFNIPVRTQ